MFTLNVNGSTTDSASRYMMFTNAVTFFVGSIEDLGFLFVKSSSSGNNMFEGENGTMEILYSVNFLFIRNDKAVLSGMVVHSDTEFLAANKLTELFNTTSSHPLPVPTNSTYQTDFIVLSRNDSGIATRHALALLLSAKMAADIRVGSDFDDVSQLILLVISKVEVLRDMLSSQTASEVDENNATQISTSNEFHTTVTSKTHLTNTLNTIVEVQSSLTNYNSTSVVSTQDKTASLKISNRIRLYLGIGVIFLFAFFYFIRKKPKQGNP